MAHTMDLAPHFEETPCGPQLFVDGKPFLCLPGELHNSSFSDAKHMMPLWDEIKSANINTVLGAVTWDQIEPRENHFDFSDLDANILAARSRGLRLVLLWFGSYKNGLSTYVPSWVKLNPARFPRVLVKGQEDVSLRCIEMLSPFAPQNYEADARAFRELMYHLTDIDLGHHTVIMVQVENEPGLLGDSRDRSLNAEAAFKRGVRNELIQGLARRQELHDEFSRRFPNFGADCSHGDEIKTWQSLFGSDADEMFMADALSQYIDFVAASGKAVSSLPMFLNAWLNCDNVDNLDLEGIPLKHNMTTVAGGGAVAGDYPSGGACPHVFDVYKVNAPHIDFLSPDVYLHDYGWVCAQYRVPGNPLFIPEQKREEHGARRLMLAYGSFAAVGCAPFGIDSAPMTQSLYAKVFGVLDTMADEIHAARARGPQFSFGFFFDELGRKNSKESWSRTFDEWQIRIERAYVFGKQGPGCGMLIYKGDGEFLCLGWGYSVSVTSADSKKAFTGILSATELVKMPNARGFRPGRRLNGDETRSGMTMIMPNDDPDYGGFPIAITAPAKTYMANLKVYSIPISDC